MCGIFQCLKIGNNVNFPMQAYVDIAINFYTFCGRSHRKSHSINTNIFKHLEF